jgi:hypothetical protein
LRGHALIMTVSGDSIMSDLEAFNASVHCGRVEIVREHGERLDYRLDCRFGRITGRIPAVYGRSHTGLYGTSTVTTRTRMRPTGGPYGTVTGTRITRTVSRILRLRWGSLVIAGPRPSP